ncbi:MAG: family intrarane metalloprotease [Actinomycetospora sp.]|nr:family intrarane metalloprotease [Actinomycetospora sp.]
MAGTTTDDAMAIRRAARRGLTVFLPLVIVLSGAVEAWVILSPDRAILGIALLMCCPAVASIVTRLVLREGFADVSFRLGGARALPWYAVAVLLPFVVGALAYGAAAAVGLIGFTGGAVGVVVALGGVFLLSLPSSLVLAAGEEIGWRGYLLPRMVDAGAPAPLLLTGLIWSAWHLPLVLAGLYIPGGSLALTVALFVVSATSISFVLARMRLATGSVWTAVVAHGVWNAVIQGPFDSAATGEQATLWVGEAGVFTAVVLVVVAVVITRGRAGRTRVELGRRPGETGRPGAPAPDAGAVSA